MGSHQASKGPRSRPGQRRARAEAMDEGMGHERTPLPYHSEDLDALEGIPGQETEPFRANCGHTEISEAVVYQTISAGSDV